MPVIIDQVLEGRPGDDLFLASESEDGRVAVVFEDDGDTGYFYAWASVNGPILDALHVYNVASIVDRDRPSEYKIGWSLSGRQAILIITGQAHAVCDFDREKGWCRSGFPASNRKWSLDGHDWDEACIGYFR